MNKSAISDKNNINLNKNVIKMAKNNPLLRAADVMLKKENTYNNIFLKTFVNVILKILLLYGYRL